MGMIQANLLSKDGKTKKNKEYKITSITLKTVSCLLVISFHVTACSSVFCNILHAGYRGNPTLETSTCSAPSVMKIEHRCLPMEMNLTFSDFWQVASKLTIVAKSAKMIFAYLFGR